MSAAVPLLTRPEELAELAAALAREPSIALDTEATGYHRFHERICLVQLSSRKDTWLLDALVMGDLSPLGGIMADARVELVIHDADYDLRLFKKNYGFRAVRVFDTFIAAELLNEEQLSLAGLLEKYAGEKLDKKFQKADWSQRPLTQAMLDYAAKDTRHLLELRDVLAKKLVEKGRMTWAQEEFDRLIHIPFEVVVDDEPGFLKLKGAKALRPHQLAVLRELHAWRDQLAERLDRAPFMMLGNDVMLDLAKDPPNDRRSLAARKGVGDRIMERNGEAILRAIERGRAVPKEEWPRVPKSLRYDRDPEFDDRVKRLRVARERLMIEHDLRPGIVGANHLLAAIARRMPTTLEELRTIDGIRNYQVDVFGQDLLNAL